MRQYRPLMLIPLTLLLAACADSGEDQVAQALDQINVIDETNLNDIMLTVGDPNEAVTYFANASAQAPDRIDLKRGLATSLVRAGRAAESIVTWQEVVAHPEATDADKVDLADTLIRANQWDAAAQVLASIPPTYETFKRYRLEAMIADSRQQWERADSFYETAVGLTTQPAGVYNNWGFSKLTRGAYSEAERLFIRAIQFNGNLYAAKNNLILARGAQREYTLPVIPMTQIERAQLLHSLALTAIKQNDIAIGKSLLNDAINTHPQFFEEAVRALEALDGQA